MYLTEQEAVQKWCPMVRDANIGALHAAVNRNTRKDPPDIIAPATCIGSACMMWREGPEPSTKLEAIRDHYARTKVSLAESKAYVEAHPELTAATGYCGLAGEPK